MKTKKLFLLISIIFPLLLPAQNSAVKTSWTLEECIEYALQQNIDIRESGLANQSNRVYAEQAKWQKYPSVNASVSKNFNWANNEDTATGESDFSGSNNTSYSVNSSITLFNGNKLNYKVKQAELNFESGKYNSETIKETVSLSILNAFLQVLYAEELVSNSEKQIESTTGQLHLAEERLARSIISRSDYLQVKSELASEKLTLANARSEYSIAKVNLMQYMELPVTGEFNIVHPKIENTLNKSINPDAQSVYISALTIKPQVKNAGLNKESATFDEKIARADFYPSLSLNAGLGTGYSSLTSGMNYFNQLDNKINPSFGLSLSIPVFQQNQAKTNIQLAKIGIQNAELNELSVKNQLRKEIEQACVDVSSAQIQYEASQEQFQAIQESYSLAEEKFKNGLINSVDFLIEKTNLIVAESDLLQSKYNLIFNYKILDFYSGVPISL